MSAAILHWIIVYKYILIAPFSIIEGPILGLVCGFLIKLRLLSFFPTFPILMLGDIISDAYWYLIGYTGGRKVVLKYGKFFSISDEKFAVLEKIYQKHFVKILFLSKITMGLGFAIPIVAAAGMNRIPFKKYMLVNILSQPLWTGMLVSAGYFGGTLYLQINNGLQLLFLIASIIIFLLLAAGFTKYLRAIIFAPYL